MGRGCRWRLGRLSGRSLGGHRLWPSCLDMFSRSWNGWRHRGWHSRKRRGEVGVGWHILSRSEVIIRLKPIRVMAALLSFMGLLLLGEAYRRTNALDWRRGSVLIVAELLGVLVVILFSSHLAMGRLAVVRATDDRVEFVGLFGRSAIGVPREPEKKVEVAFALVEGEPGIRISGSETVALRISAWMLGPKTTRELKKGLWV